MLTAVHMTPTTMKEIRTLAARLRPIVEEEEKRRREPPLSSTEFTLRETLKNLKYGEISELALKLGLTRAYLHDVKNGRRRVSESLARKLATLK
jgi:Helix-turn-helix